MKTTAKLSLKEKDDERMVKKKGRPPRPKQQIESRDSNDLDKLYKEFLKNGGKIKKIAPISEQDREKFQ